MSRMIKPLPVLRVCSCLTADASLLKAASKILIEEFGPVFLVSEAFPFDFTTYYEPELGVGIKRYWLCFEVLFGADELVSYRHKTGLIEDSFAVNGLRKVNLDPGYLDYGKLVLASLKGGADKIYMGDSVWAHTCLRYRSGAYVAPDHSFPDFQQGIFNHFFISLRKEYKDMLKSATTLAP